MLLKPLLDRKRLPALAAPENLLGGERDPASVGLRKTCADCAWITVPEGRSTPSGTGCEKQNYKKQVHHRFEERLHCNSCSVV